MNGTDKALAELIGRFGQSAPELWAVLVASQRLEAIVFIVVMAAVVAVGMWVMRRLAAKSRDVEDAAIVWIGGGFLTLLTGLLVALIVCVTVTTLVYPEASALKSLTGTRR